jgi:hypothetical protein
MLDKVADNIKINILSSITFLLIIMLFMRCGKIIARQATDDNIIWCMHFAYWIPRVQTQTQNMLHLLLFYGINSYTNMLECFVHMYTTRLLMLVSINSKDSGPEKW